MFRKRRTLSIAGAVAAGMLIAACGGSSEGSSGEGGATAEAGPVTLTYWDFIDPSQDNPRSNALAENIANFEAANPDIDVELAVVSLGDMLNRLPQTAAAGQAPDVFKMFTPQVPQMASAGVYEPLPEAAAEITDWRRPVDNLTGPDGEQIAVPYEYRTCVLYYNEDILAEIGAEVPTTYDEVVDVAAQASEAGYTGFGTGFSDTDNSAIISTFFDCFMSQVGADIWNEDGEADFAGSEAEEFGQFLEDLQAAGALGNSVVSDSYSTVTDGLANGTVAMAVLGTERIVSWAEPNPNLKWTSLPRASVGDDTGTTLGWTMGIGAGSDNVDAAWTFIEYMTGPEGGTLLATGGEVPTREVTYSEEYFATPEADVVNSIAEYVESNSEPRSYSDNWIGLASGLAAAGQRLVLDGVSGSEFISSAQDAANQ